MYDWIEEEIDFHYDEYEIFDNDELNLEQFLHIVRLIDFYLLKLNDNVDQPVVRVNVEEILREKLNVQ
jgi:hypothetical protein